MQVLALFLGAFIVDFEYSLFIVNVIKCCLMVYLCGTPNRRYLYGSCSALWGILHRSLQSTLAREHVNTQDMLAREHISTLSTLACKHVRHVATREHISTQSMLAREHVST